MRVPLFQKTLNAMSLSTVPATEESFLIANIYALYLAAQHDETQEGTMNAALVTPTAMNIYISIYPHKKATLIAVWINMSCYVMR